MPAKGRSLMTEYIRLLWKHPFPDEPIDMYYEVLPGRAVPRMVEIFPGGRAECDRLDWYLKRYPTARGDSLIEVDMETADQVRAKLDEHAPGEFEVFEVTQQEFEMAFANATPRT
jgi:hypothetical protein